MTPRQHHRKSVNKLRGEIKRTLHIQLDALLMGPTRMPDGTTGTVLEDIMVRTLVGYGFSVNISVRHPEEEGRVAEDPTVTQALTEPKPLIEVVR